MGNKHPAPDEQPVEPADDLERNPGIGQSKSLFGRKDKQDSQLIEGENTVEGDIENDASLGQGADRDLGRTNE